MIKSNSFGLLTRAEVDYLAKLPMNVRGQEEKRLRCDAQRREIQEKEYARQQKLKNLRHGENDDRR